MRRRETSNRHAAFAGVVQNGAASYGKDSDHGEVRVEDGKATGVLNDKGAGNVRRDGDDQGGWAEVETVETRKEGDQGRS